jgi:carbamoyltransferase
MKILGLHLGHDASATLVVDGRVVADVLEERFSRRKHERSFPFCSIEFCLRQGGITSNELDCIAIPGSAFPKLLRCIFGMAQKHDAIEFNLGKPRKVRVAGKPEPSKFGLPSYFHRFQLSDKCLFFLAGHHAAHAASAYYPSGIDDRALVATLDGIGEGISVGLWRAEQGKLLPLQLYGRGSSLGWFYSNITEALGWRHSSDEWKVMGLAAYGKPEPEALSGLHPEYHDGQLAHSHEYTPFKIWDYNGERHYNGGDTQCIVEIGTRLGRENLAAEAQRVVEEQTMRLLLPWLEKEALSTLLCAGGVFLNVKLNQKLWQSGKILQQWIPPNPGDGGLAMGAALLAHADLCPKIQCNPIRHVSLGPEFSSDEIRKTLRERGLDFEEVDNAADAAIFHLIKNRVVGWFQGRMESGPRALGNRSILMDPRRVENKALINAKVKFREAFRPFCPSILAAKAFEYLVNPRDERFMASSFSVKKEYRLKMPAVVHVDGTTRPQFVHREEHPLYYELIEHFGKKTGVYALLNTSFNVKGEPIVCTPRDALRTFFDSGLDVLIMNQFVVKKPSLS